MIQYSLFPIFFSSTVQISNLRQIFQDKFNDSKYLQSPELQGACIIYIQNSFGKGKEQDKIQINRSAEYCVDPR